MAGSEPEGSDRSLRNAVWAVSAFLAIVGMLAGLYTAQPWPSRDRVAQLEKDVERLAKEDEKSQLVRERNTSAIQALQYEVRQIRDRHLWAEAELEALRAYVYPQNRVAPARPKPQSPVPWSGDR